MCSLRDVLEVFGGFRPSFWGLEDPGEREYATCATFWTCSCRIQVFFGLGRTLRAGMCDLRDVPEVFRRSACVRMVRASDYVSFARRFGGIFFEDPDVFRCVLSLQG